MIKRINIFTIIKDHFSTLRRFDSDSKKIYWKDIILFVGIPAIVGYFLSFQGFIIKSYIGNLIAAISIFGGFLFNLLAIIYSQIDKIKDDADKENNKIKKKFVKEIHSNISYSILLSLIIIILLITCTTSLPSFNYDWLLKEVFLSFTYAILIHFLLSLLMVLNRVYILLKKDSE